MPNFLDSAATWALQSTAVILANLAFQRDSKSDESLLPNTLGPLSRGVDVVLLKLQARMMAELNRPLNADRNSASGIFSNWWSAIGWDDQLLPHHGPNRIGLTGLCQMLSDHDGCRGHPASRPAANNQYATNKGVI